MKKNQLARHSKIWDRSGILVTFVCLLHCLALPLLITAIPFGHNILRSHWLETLLLCLGVLFGSMSFLASYRQHHKLGPFLVGASGMILLIVNLTGGFFSHFVFHAEMPELEALVIAGGCLLICGHLWNMYACHCFCADHSKQPKHLTN